MVVGSTMNSTRASMPPSTAARLMTKFWAFSPRCSLIHLSSLLSSASKASSPMLISAEYIRHR